MVAQLLQTAADHLAQASLTAEWHTRYVAERDKLVNDVGKLATNTVIDPDKVKINELLGKAKTEVEGTKYPAAMKLLQKGAVACNAAGVKLKMHAKTVPGPDELKKIAEFRPDGLEMLDEIVAGLGEDAPRKVLAAALEARYDIKLEMFTGSAKGDKNDSSHVASMEKGGKSLKKIYELMAKVPDSHTTDNPSMELVKRYGGANSDVANFYSDSKALVALSCGRSKDTRQEKFGDPKHLPDVEPDCQPQGPQPKLFDSTTLHEVGHSVDDKLGFMKRNGSNALYGGWKDYGGNVRPVAEAAAAAFKYDAGYIARFLCDEPAPPPARDEKKAATDKEWDANREEAEKWCAGIRGKIWWKGDACKTLAIGAPKRVYQESYAGQWVSYLLEARNKGISGYQFRAPGEWFAEIYAAYFCDSLKPTNPAVAWLKDFKRPTK